MRLDTPVESERLLLRTLTPRDAEGSYLSWFQNPDTLRFLEARFDTHTQESIVDYITSTNNDPAELLLGIFLKESGEHIGNIKLLNINFNYQRADIGLVIGEKSQRGKGFATEAIKTIVSYAGNVLGLHRAVAGCHANNPGSYNAFIKAGFEEEGRLRHHDRIDDEWVDVFILGRLLS
jgi:ribosomal-protein-alanine N-acetyltransferase